MWHTLPAPFGSPCDLIPHRWYRSPGVPDHSCRACRCLDGPSIWPNHPSGWHKNARRMRTRRLLWFLSSLLANGLRCIREHVPSCEAKGRCQCARSGLFPCISRHRCRGPCMSMCLHMPPLKQYALNPHLLQEGFHPSHLQHHHGSVGLPVPFGPHFHGPST